jgi:hypothetical protein
MKIQKDGKTDSVVLNQKMGEGKVRDALGTKRNNMFARGFANIKKAGVEALGGTVAQTR